MTVSCTAKLPLVQPSWEGDRVLVEGELTYREYNRTVETESGPIQLAWPATEVLVDSVSRLARIHKVNKNTPEETA